MTIGIPAAWIVAELEPIDPPHRLDQARVRSDFAITLEPFMKSLPRGNGTMPAFRLTASEPVFGYMAGAFGLKMRTRDLDGSHEQY